MSPLDDQVRAALGRILTSFNGQLEAELQATGSDILRAAADAQALAVSEAITRAAAEAAERAASEVRQEAELQLTALQQQFERQRDDLQQSRAVEVSGLQQSITELREELAAARREIGERRVVCETLEAQLSESRRDFEAAQAYAQELQRQTEEAARQIADAETQTARAEEEARTRAEELQFHNDAAARQYADAEARLTRAGEEIDRIRRDIVRIGRVAADLRALESSASLGEVLEALAGVACQEAGRSAVFLVDRGRLKGWRARGFAAEDSIVGSELEPLEAGIVGDALGSGRQEHRNEATGRLPPFAEDDGARDVLALPVEVAGSVIAVLYADAPRSDNREGPPWMDIVEMMARYAGRLLETMTVRHAAAMWAPRRHPGSQQTATLHTE